MDTVLNNVRDFHRHIGATVAESPTLLACETESAREMAIAIRELLARCQAVANDSGGLLPRLCLDLEELAEWVEAHAANDLVAAADAWGDRMYVLLGDAVATGLPAGAVFGEVHRSNMSKAAAQTGRLGKGTKTAAFQRPRLREILFPNTHTAGPTGDD